MSIDESPPGQTVAADRAGHHHAEGRFTPMRPDYAVRLPTNQTRRAEQQERSPTMQILPTRSTWAQPWGTVTHGGHLNGVEPVQISRLVEWRHRGCC